MALALSALVPLAAPSLSGPPAYAARTALATFRACTVSQIRVSASATEHNVSYVQRTPRGAIKAAAKEAVPVYFYNDGATCHLLMGAPEFRAVKGASSVAAITMDDLSIPVGADNERRVVLARHHRVEVLFVVQTPSAMTGVPCDPATTSGLLVGGYANPIASTHFIARRLHNVCFHSGVGRNNVNDGVVWVPTR